MIKNKYLKYFLVLQFIFLISCDTVESNRTSSLGGDLVGPDSVEVNNTNSNNWLIPKNEVVDGGPGKDGIPSIDSPKFTDIGNVTLLSNDDLVIVFKRGNEIRIYPHPILDWHEIINDKIGITAFAINYCPLTGSAFSWDRIIEGEESTFGVSGLLYNNNLILYDRQTGSNWSQMLIKSVNGSLISSEAKIYPIVETSWETAKISFPNAKVLSLNTGFGRNYSKYPYGNYRTNNSLFLFPVKNIDNRIDAKTRVLGIIESDVEKAYSIHQFEGERLIVDYISSNKYLIYGDRQKNILTAFRVTSENIQLEFKKSSLPLPYILEDNFGNHYDLFGHSKENNTADLPVAKSFIAYWFAWAAFYPNTQLYNN